MIGSEESMSFVRNLKYTQAQCYKHRYSIWAIHLSYVLYANKCYKESPRLYPFLLYCCIIFIVMRLPAFPSGGATQDAEPSVAPASIFIYS